MADELAPVCDPFLAFALFLTGMTQREIATQMGCSQQYVSKMCVDNDWVGQREMVMRERIGRVTGMVSKEQEFLRAQECQYARRLMGLAEQMLRTVSTKDATLLDLTRVLDMASRLGRLGSGLPLNQVEVTQTYDLGEHLMAAIERAYAPQVKAPAPTIDLPPAAAPPKV